MLGKISFPGHRNVLIALLALVIALAALFSITRGTSLPVSIRSLFWLLIACNLGVFLPLTLETLTWLCFFLGMAGVFTSIVTLTGVICACLGSDLFAFVIKHPHYIYGLPQVESYFGNPNAFGLFLVFCIAAVAILFVLYRRQRENNKLIALSFYVVLAIELVAFTLTFSRAAFVALSLFVTCFTWLNNRRFSFTPLVLISAAVFTSRQALLNSSMAEMLNALFSGRIQLWAEGFKLFNQYPLLGTGLGGWFAISGNPLSLHNTYLHLAVELGLAGLVLYVLYIALFMGDLKKEMNRAVICKPRYAVLSGLYSLSLGLLAHQLFESYLYYGLPLFLFAIIPVHALIRESGQVFRFHKTIWIQQGDARIYRKAG